MALGCPELACYFLPGLTRVAVARAPRLRRLRCALILLLLLLQQRLRRKPLDLQHRAYGTRPRLIKHI